MDDEPHERLTFTDYFPKWFDRYIVVHSIFLVSLIAVHCLYIIFAPKFEENCITTFIVILVIATTSQLMSRIMRALLKAELFQKPAYYKGLIAVTLWVIMMLGFLARYVVFFVQWNYYALLCLILFFLWIPMDIYKDTRRYDVHYVKNSKLILWLIVIHFILLVAFIRLGVEFSSGMNIVSIISFQFLFFSQSLIANIDLAMILTGATKWNYSVELVNWAQVAPVDLEAAEEEKRIENGPIIECTICVRPYSPKNLPRILKECGHSICTDCASRLLAQHNNHYMYCPICRMVTVVRGLSTQIPVNHSLMGLMEELRNPQREFFNFVITHFT